MLEHLNSELEPLEDSKALLDQKAVRRTNILVWGGLAYMAAQFGFLARLTWWEYSWDIMEPVTYFVTYGSSIAMYAYFVLTREVGKFFSKAGHGEYDNPPSKIITSRKPGFFPSKGVLQQILKLASK